MDNLSIVESLLGNIQGPGNREQKDELRKVATDMEALFAHQLIKLMRETSENASLQTNGLGYSTYMSMFDMELSKIFAERGLGLKDAIMQQMERASRAAMPTEGKKEGDIE